MTSGFARFSRKRWTIHPRWCEPFRRLLTKRTRWSNYFSNRPCQSRDMPRNVPNFRNCVKVQISAILGHISRLTRPIQKLVRPPCPLSQERSGGVHTISDESPIFSLKIEQNHSSPITKFITDLTNTLFDVERSDTAF